VDSFPDARIYITSCTACAVIIYCLFFIDISSARRYSIITLHQTGNYTKREMAKYVKVPQSSVSRIIHLWRETVSVEPQRIGGPPTNRRFSTHDVCMLVRASKQDPKATAHLIQERTRGSVPKASIRTIQWYLRNNGRIEQRPSAAPVLSAINKKKRLQWARLHANWTAKDWSKVSTMTRIIKCSSGDNQFIFSFSFRLCLQARHISM
jgi:hypothetical protein